MHLLYEQYHYNVSKGPLYEDASALPLSSPVAKPVKLIAYYLPQFHAIPENDQWWGVGFTEWSNVTKALPRYLGHLQPRLPADLGFYNLRQVDVLRRQAELARRAGIYGFCIHNYWFNGRQVLDTPLRLVLENRDIDLRFCLNWANENWSRRWDGSDTDVLLHQHYDPKNNTGYVASILPALRDQRYIRVGDRPLIMVYRPKLIPQTREFMACWRSFLIEQGVGDPYLVMAQTFDDDDPRPYGMDAAAGFPPHNGGWRVRNDRNRLHLLDRRYFDGFSGSYEELAKRMLQNRLVGSSLFPGVCPGFDNEARRPGRGSGYYGSTPATYGSWLRQAAEIAAAAPCEDERIVFINAWNEWAEGALLEPDRHFGYAYLAETRRVLDELAGAAAAPRRSSMTFSRLSHPRLSAGRFLFNKAHGAWRKVVKTLGGN